MATFHAFIGALRPGTPSSFDGITYYHPVSADVLVLNNASVVQIPGNETNPGLAILSLSSIDGFVAGDDVNSLRRKLVANIRPQYPQIAANDTILAKWMSDVGLITLNLGL